MCPAVFISEFLRTVLVKCDWITVEQLRWHSYLEMTPRVIPRRIIYRKAIKMLFNNVVVFVVNV
jgi:hypothetical protein